MHFTTTGDEGTTGRRERKDLGLDELLEGRLQRARIPWRNVLLPENTISVEQHERVVREKPTTPRPSRPVGGS